MQIINKENMTEKTSDTLELCLYFLLVLLSDLLLVPFLSVSKGDNGRLKFDINWKDSLPPYLFIPLIAVLFGLLVFLWVRRYKFSHKRMSPILICLVVIYSVYRCIGIFLFPYGPQQYSMEYQSNLYHINYSGFSFYNRITTWISETYYILFLAFLYQYTPTYSNKIHKFLNYFLLAFVLVGLTAIGYSAIVEGKAMFNSWKAFLQSGCKELTIEMFSFKSFTTHRNVFAFLLMFGSFASALLIMKTNHLSWLLFNMLFTSWTILILSRTAFAFQLILLIVVLISYPIHHFHSHKKTSVFCIAILTAAFFATVFIFQFDSGFLKHFIDKIGDFFQNKNSLMMRNTHADIVMKMITNPYYFIFGYNRAPFLGIYPEFEVRIIPNDLTWTAHNSYLQLWMDSGLLALVFAICAFINLFFQSIYLTFKKSKKYSLYTLLFAFLSIYAYLEPRMLFLREGSTVLFILMILIPLQYDYQKFKPTSPSFKALIKNID